MLKTIEAGTSWVIKDGPDHMPTPPVLEGNEQDFRAADELRDCLCIAVPTSLSGRYSKEDPFEGINWKAEPVDENTVRVTLIRPLEYDTDDYETQPVTAS